MLDRAIRFVQGIFSTKKGMAGGPGAAAGKAAGAIAGAAKGAGKGGGKPKGSFLKGVGKKLKDKANKGVTVVTDNVGVSDGAAIGLGLAAGRGVAHVTARAAKGASDPGFLFAILGTLVFFKNTTLSNMIVFQTTAAGTISAAVLISIVFMWMAAIMLFENQGIFTTAAFSIWFLGFGAPDVTQNLYVGVLIFFLALLAHGFWNSVTKKGSFGDGLRGELLTGFTPVLFFLIDVGAVEFFVLGINSLPWFNIHPQHDALKILLVIPWWGYLGLSKMRWRESALKKILFVAGVLSLIITVIPIATAASGKTEAVFSFDDLAQAKKDFSLECEKQRTLFSFSCLGGLFSGNPDIQSCTQEKLADCTLTAECKARAEEFDMDTCKARLKKEKSQRLLEVPGAVDPTIKEETVLEFLTSDYPKEYTRREGQVSEFSMTFGVENPRRHQFEVEFSCEFKKGVQTLPGKIVENEKAFVTGTSFTQNVKCSPEEALEGKYQVEFTALATGLTTRAHIERAFFSETRPDSWIREWVPKILTAHFPGNQGSLSAPEPAQLNFGVGMIQHNFPLEVTRRFKGTKTSAIPVIQVSGDGDNLFVAAELHNKGKGKISRIEFYDLEMDGFAGDGSGCFQGTRPDIVLSGPRKTIPLVDCFITQVPPELSDSEDYVLRDFTGTVKYDYTLTQAGQVTIKEVKARE